jgi:hypothetical protein
VPALFQLALLAQALSHTLAVYPCHQSGLGSLRFADLLTSNPHTPGQPLAPEEGLVGVATAVGRQIAGQAAVEQRPPGMIKRSSSSLTSTSSSRAGGRSACSGSSASHNEGCSAKKLRVG